jgi:hypothetical protein
MSINILLLPYFRRISDGHLHAIDRTRELPMGHNHLTHISRMELAKPLGYRPCDVI